MHVKASTPFADLLSDGQAVQVTLKFEQLIMESFATDAGREAIAKGTKGKAVATAAEIKRRFNILADWFKTLRGDLGWSLQRIFTELPFALRAKLDGQLYVPNTRSSWAPTEPATINGDLL